MGDHRGERDIDPTGQAPIYGAYGPKPEWRGRLHKYAFFVTLPAGLWLLAGAHTAAARVAVAIYWASLAGLFGTRVVPPVRASERAVTWLRRADHSMIFVLIAGSYTPFCLLVLPRVWGNTDAGRHVGHGAGGDHHEDDSSHRRRWPIGLVAVRRRRVERRGRAAEAAERTRGGTHGAADHRRPALHRRSDHSRTRRPNPGGRCSATTRYGTRSRSRPAPVTSHS
ncbi:MAG: hemolysin III family protein [Actinobacteria bacterium]|nr:hemolysin III family protein [Actinomycetota bacterium]